MRLGKVAGSDVKVNDYFLLLLGVYFLLGVLPQALLLFTAVAWHEFCHLVAARKVGFPPQSIELFPFGGVARFSSPLSFYPDREIRIALAGPLGSLVLAVFLHGAAAVLKWETAWVRFLLQVNLVLGCFNLLPGLPLDGGRVFRAWRAGRAGPARATWEGAVLGQTVAVCLAVGGSLGFWLRVTDLQSLIVALFIFQEATREKEVYPYLFWREFWRHRREEKGLLAEVCWLAATGEQPLTRIVKGFKSGRYNIVVVLGPGGQIKGMVSEGEILRALGSGRSAETIDRLLKV
ncbi:MAG: site-2 protease family protein [Moorellaceae bacterium]